MTKITLNNVADLTNFTTSETTINNNSSTIQTAMDNTLSRDGTAPNQMGANLDMNSNRILNLPVATNTTEPVTLGTFNSLITSVGNMPAGGTVGQSLTKVSSTDFAASWASDPQLSAAVGSNILTITLTNNAGTTPSVANPVIIGFSNPSLPVGLSVYRAITSALSISTIVGASLGTVNTVPFRIWVVAFDNAGTVVLGLYQTVAGGIAPTSIAAMNEANLVSSTQMNAGATSAGVFYSPSGITITTKAFRILGYVDYATGLATVGTYASAPTTVQMFGPGVKKPGDPVQRVYSTTTATTTTTSSTATATVNTISITPTASPNLILVRANGSVLSSSAASNVLVAVRRGTTPQIGAGHAYGGANNIRGEASHEVLDAPGTTTTTSYTVYMNNGDNTTSISYPTNSAAFTITGAMIAEEIQV